MAKVKAKKKVLKQVKPVRHKESPKRQDVKAKVKKSVKSNKPVLRQSKIEKPEKSNGAKFVKPAAPKPLSAELLGIRSRLTTMLTDLRKDIDHEVRGAAERDLAHINDTSDMASDSAEGDLALRIAESETAEASEIERALEKIDNGTYGQCEVCNKAINAERLAFLPYVTMCIKCQELAEIRKRSQGDELDDLAEGTDSDNDG